MAIRRDLPEFVQASLMAQEILEMTIKIGVVVEGDHLQAQIELRNPVDGVLLDLWSTHHARLERWEHLLMTVSQQAEQMVADQVGSRSPLYKWLLLRERLSALEPGSPPPDEPFP
jgi:hypothetical protein